jgi:3-oxoacyl-[acyl-carrier protein] reductase
MEEGIMELGLNGRRAVVTASSEGIGRAIALGLAKEGVRVLMCARREELLNDTAAEIRSITGAEVHAVPADVSVGADRDRLATEARERFGGVDILVNNAGGPPSGAIATLGEDAWQAALDTNLNATIRLTYAFLPGMQAQRWGRILNIVSTSAKEPFANLSLSNVTRAGVVAFAKTLATEAGPDNVLVNNIAPGAIWTERSRKSVAAQAKAQGISEEEAKEASEQGIPLRRIGAPEELANLAVFLASDAASYITGTTIQVDGGLVKGLF